MKSGAGRCAAIRACLLVDLQPEHQVSYIPTASVIGLFVWPCGGALAFAEIMAFVLNTGNDECILSYSINGHPQRNSQFLLVSLFLLKRSILGCQGDPGRVYDRFY